MSEQVTSEYKPDEELWYYHANGDVYRVWFVGAWKSTRTGTQRFRVRRFVDGRHIQVTPAALSRNAPPPDAVVI